MKRLRLVPRTGRDSRNEFFTYVRSSPKLKSIRLLGHDTVELADELVPVLRSVAATFGLEVHDLEN